VEYNSQVLKYLGYIDKDIISGNGTLICKDGSQYKGEFKNGDESGFGEKIFLEESPLLNYSGDWQQGRMWGKGKVFWKNGAKYVGGFQKDKIWGYGILTDDGDVITGFWEGTFTYGNGSAIFKNGIKFFGFFANGWLNGYAVVYYQPTAEVWKFEGIFKDGLQCGNGTAWLRNGSR